MAPFAGVTCSFPCTVACRLRDLRIRMLALARLLQDYGMLAPPSAALLLLNVTAQPTGRLQCLVRAARARPGLVDKGVSHHSCRGYTALRGRKPLNSRPCCRVADDKAALGVAAPVSAYPRMSSQLVSDSSLRPMANCILVFVCYPQWSSPGTVWYSL